MLPHIEARNREFIRRLSSEDLKYITLENFAINPDGRFVVDARNNSQFDYAIENLERLVSIAESVIGNSIKYSAVIQCQLREYACNDNCGKSHGCKLYRVGSDD